LWSGEEGARGGRAARHSEKRVQGGQRTEERGKRKEERGKRKEMMRIQRRAVCKRARIEREWRALCH